MLESLQTLSKKIVLLASNLCKYELIAEVYSEPCVTSKMECFVKLTAKGRLLFLQKVPS